MLPNRGKKVGENVLDGKPKCFLSELPADASQIKVFSLLFTPTRSSFLLFRLQLLVPYINFCDFQFINNNNFS